MRFSARSFVGLASSVGLFGLLALGCEDPIPPAPQGAFTVQLTDTGADCDIASHKTGVGNAEGTEPELITNGASDVTVSCLIEAAGGGFKVSASIDGKAALNVEIASIAGNQSQDAPAEGQVSYTSTETGGEGYSSGTEQPCTFWVDADAGQYVKEAEAWISFRCPSVGNADSICSLSGAFALKNCEGSTTEEE